MKTYTCDEKPGMGRYICTKCGEDLHLDENADTLPPCARCNNCEFREG